MFECSGSAVAGKTSYRYLNIKRALPLPLHCLKCSAATATENVARYCPPLVARHSDITIRKDEIYHCVILTLRNFAMDVATQ